MSDTRKDIRGTARGAGRARSGRGRWFLAGLAALALVVGGVNAAHDYNHPGQVALLNAHDYN